MQARTDYAANLGPRVPVTDDIATQWNDGGPISFDDAQSRPAAFFKGREYNDGGVHRDWLAKIHGIVFQATEYKMSQILDGTAKTYMVGEKYLQPEFYNVARGEFRGVQNFADDQRRLGGRRLRHVSQYRFTIAAAPRPGLEDILSDERRTDALKPYVVEVVGRFANDKRVLLWDLFNEPDNPNKKSYGPLELTNKDEAAVRLLKRSFQWAREANPSQPLTVGVWAGGPWNNEPGLNHVHRAALAESDVISFHNYGNPDEMKARLQELKPLNRPLLCTEFMARGNGSTFEAILPVLAEEKIAAYCWGLVDGKSQTKYPWNSWQMPVAGEPNPWHHDIFHADGRPYRKVEVEFIKRIAAPAEAAMPITASGG